MTASLASLASHVRDALGASLVVADGAIPEAGWTGGWQTVAGQRVYTGYVVLSDISGGSWDGPVGLPRDDLTAVYQAQCVGATAQQARTITDIARDAVLGLRRTTVGDRLVSEVRFDFGSETTLVDRDVSPPVFYVPLRFRLVTTPI